MMRRAKAVLLALLLVGAVASFGGGGTFSSFSAQATNANSSLATGTLALSDQVNTGTVCLSAAGTDNLNPGCDAVLQLTNAGPGSWNAGLQTATVTIKNTGSIGASKLYLWTPSACQDAKTTTSLVPGALTGTALTFNPASVTTSGTSGPITTYPLCAASLLYVEETTGGFHYCWYGNGSSGTNGSATGNPSGACTTPVSVKLTSALASGTTYTTLPVTDLNGTVQAGDTITASCPAQASLATALNTATSPVTSLTLSSVPTAINAGDPIEVSSEQQSNLAGSALSTTASVTALPVSATPSAVSPGDSIVLADGAHTQTFVANAAVAAGSTSIAVIPEVPNFAYPASTTTVTDQTGWQQSEVFYAASSYSSTTSQQTISVNSQAVTADFAAGATVAVQLGWASHTLKFTAAQTSFPGASSLKVSGETSPTSNDSCAAGTSVVDASSENLLNSDTTDTISSFSSEHGPTGEIQLYPVVGNNEINTASTLELPAGATRTFQVGLYLPAPTGIDQNALQGLQATFSMTWHIDQ